MLTLNPQDYLYLLDPTWKLYSNGQTISYSFLNGFTPFTPEQRAATRVAPSRHTCRWLRYILIALSVPLLANRVEATSLPYMPPTMAQKVKESELIVVARVGRLKYMRWPSYPNTEGAWEVSDIPAEGFNPYLNLMEPKVFWAKPPTNDVQRANEKPNLPLWVQLGGCFQYTGAPPVYPPTGEVRAFFSLQKTLAVRKWPPRI